MYSEVLGLGSNEFGSELDSRASSIDEFSWELQEAPIDKPY